VHVKATASDADPAAGASGWVAINATGHFGINASDNDLESVDIDTSQPNVKERYRDDTMAPF
jgi:hypothetical protein